MRSLLPVICTIFLLAPPPSALAEATTEFCASHTKDIPIKRVNASAGTWANFRNRPGSISFESNAIFETAKAQAEHLAPISPAFCPKGCTLRPRPSMVFRSTPLKVLSEYGDAEHCTRRERDTSRRPLSYVNPSVRTVEQLNEWIGDLSQGNGTQGEDLYEKCDKSCSPRYDYLITRNPGTDSVSFTVKASIVCGHARDKDDGMYDLNSFFRWYCQRS